MKKIRNILVYLSLCLCLLLLFSCKNVFSELALNEEEKIFRTSGSISGIVDLGNAYPQSFAGKIDNLKKNNVSEQIARTGFPELPYNDGSSIFEYSLKVKCTDDETSLSDENITIIPTENKANINFFVKSVPFGKNYQLWVEVTLNGTKIMEGSSQIFKLTDEEPNLQNLSVYTKPLQNGKGSVNLKIDFTEEQLSQYNFQYKIYPLENSGADIQFTDSSDGSIVENDVTSGSYNLEIRISYKDYPLNRPFSCNEIINIFDGLQTDTWFSNGNEEYFRINQTDSKCSFIFDETFMPAIKEFYVDSESEITPTGSFFAPFNTIQQAIDVIMSQKDKDKNYTIFIKNNYTVVPDSETEYVGNISADITEPRNITIAGYKETKEISINCGNHNYSDNSTGFFNFTNENANVTLENLTLKNSNSKNAIYSSADLTLNNVNIEDCYVTYDDNSQISEEFAAIYSSSKITLNNVKITNSSASEETSPYICARGIYFDNSSETSLKNVEIASCLIKADENYNGAGIYNSNRIINVEGKIIIENNIQNDSPSNIYLTDGENSSFVVNSNLTSDSKIGITTESKPNYETSEINFGTFSSALDITSVIFSDEGYKVKVDPMNNTLTLSVDKGTATLPEKVYDDVLISLDKNKLSLKDKITVSATVNDETIPLEDNILINLYWQNEYITTVETPEINFAEIDLIPETYTLNIQITYNGNTYNSNKKVTLFDDKIAALKDSGSAPAAGTSLKVYSAESLNTISEWINKGESLKGVEFVLADDITLPENFVSIGTNETNKFEGVFDGNGKTITITSFADGSMALFGTIENDSMGEIKNLTIAGDIKYTSDKKFYGIVTSCEGNITIRNCVSKCNTSWDYTAGITNVVENNSYIINCRNEGDLYGSTFAAGIAYRINNGGYIINCSNSGNITSGVMFTSGIVGISYPGSNIINCYNTGDIKGKQKTGGIIGGMLPKNGNTASINVINCFNSGNIIVEGDEVGGIIGYVFGSVKSLRISNCINYGIISSPETNQTYFGGIMGNNSISDNSLDIVNAYSLITCLPSNYESGIEYSTGNGFADKIIKISSLENITTELNAWVELNNTFENYELLNWTTDENGNPIFDIGN